MQMQAVWLVLQHMRQRRDNERRGLYMPLYTASITRLRSQGKPIEFPLRNGDATFYHITFIMNMSTAITSRFAAFQLFKHRC